MWHFWRLYPIISLHDGRKPEKDYHPLDNLKEVRQIQRSRVRLPALPDFLRISVSRTGSTEPREYT
jgi:hypothetical protein